MGIAGFIHNPNLGIWVVGGAILLGLIIATTLIRLGKDKVRFLFLWSIVLLMFGPIANIVYWFLILRPKLKIKESGK